MKSATVAKERFSEIVTHAILDNPVVTKEFRTRMRGWKAFMVMGGYCLVMAAVLVISYYMMEQAAAMRGMHASGAFTNRAALGRDLFVALAWAQTILLTLIAPALSSGSLTQEIERKTIEMVALTPLSSGRLVLGKQLADFTYTLILIACSLPLAGITLMLGGISPAEILITYALLVAWTFLLTSLGTMLSSLCKKTPIASLSSFGISIFYLIYASVTGGALMMTMYHGGGPSISPFMLLSPAWGPYGALESASVCGVKVSLALACFLLHIAYGALFLLIASTHVQHKPAERALSIRLLLLGVCVYGSILGHGSVSTQPTRQMLSYTSILSLVIMIIASIFMSTGVVRKPADKSMLGYAFSWRKMFRGDVGGAILFMLLWTALGCVVGGVATYFGANAHSLTAERGFWIAYVRVGVSILAIVGAMTAIGLLFSSLVKQRSSAAALTVLFAVAAFAGYGVIASYYAWWQTMGRVHPNQAVLQLSALWPVTPILAAAAQFKDNAPSWVNKAWIVTSVVYCAIGFFALLLAGKAHARCGGVQEE